MMTLVHKAVQKLLEDQHALCRKQFAEAWSEPGLVTVEARTGPNSQVLAAGMAATAADARPERTDATGDLCRWLGDR
eukprot:1235710-Prymnesium_polylepis.1